VEHSVDPGGEKAHQGGFPDVLVRAAEDLGRRRLDADRMNLAAWDASAAVRRDALADGCLALLLQGADAEKLAVLELACLALGGSTSVELADPAAVPLLLAALPLVSAELYKQVAGRSAAQSCAVPAFADETANSGQRAAEPAPRYWALDLVRAKLVSHYWQPEATLPELPEELRGQRLQAAEPM
jgi:hypothetical protein